MNKLVVLKIKKILKKYRENYCSKFLNIYIFFHILLPKVKIQLHLKYMDLKLKNEKENNKNNLD